ncbi:Oxygen-dependent choline dehydrogenase [Burkholderia sp. AD24]|nr:Oxygen-dependent choline dehydrogenase [Burkholderia sp. AD24]
MMTNDTDTPSGFAERVRKNQQELLLNLESGFDYIVCGAGTSGCVVAARLASDANVKVLLLEAGTDDEADLISNPNSWPMTLGSEFDWGFVAEPNPHLNGRAIPYSMGKGLGGGSSINVSTWSRGHKADWDFYASETGHSAWRYDNVLALYRNRIERWTGNPDPAYRGTNGAVHVQPAANPHEFSAALLEGAESAGLSRFPNANGRMMEAEGGCALVDETVTDGKRRSLFRSYVYPLMDQPNITVLTGAVVTRITFDKRRATGVDFEHRGKSIHVDATREVVLSLGAIHTPKLLMQSGIGNPAELGRFGIPVVQSLQGVGRNLHDHLSFGWSWENTDKPLPAEPRSQTACFWKTRDDLESPNFYAYAIQGPVSTPEIARRFNPPASSWSLVVGMRPASRGSVHLTGAHSSDPVRIEANYLAEAQDLDDLIAGLATARAIGNSAALRPYSGREIMQGSLHESGLEQFFRDAASTFWHQCSTAKMGRDEMSVVDGELKVHGIEGLRVADASVLPRVTTGNTMAPCVVIGEQVALFLQRG